MNCFQLIKTVLDDAYDQIPGEPAQKDASILAEIRTLSSAYANLTKQGSLNYKNPTTRFAYVYMYVVSHSSIVYQILQRSEELQSIFDAEKVSASCIGGGPGSDLIGMLKFLTMEKQSGKLKSFKCYLYDREQAWSDSWSDIDEQVEANFRISTHYQTFDVVDSESWNPHSRYLKSDLFTMIYFMSEVFAVKDKSNGYFEQLFSRAKSGAYFLFVDNNSSYLDCDKWFRELCASNSVEIVGAGKELMKLTLEDQKACVEDYYNKFKKMNPKLTADIAWVIGRKE